MKRWLPVLLVMALLVGPVGQATPFGQDLTTLLSRFLNDLWIGYLPLTYTVNTAAPASTACDAAAETNRTYWDSTADILYACSGASGWVPIGSINGQVIGRETFKAPHFIRLAEASSFGGALGKDDANVNMVLGSPLGIMQFREEQAKTTSSWVDTTGVLDISADDTTNDEGVEIVIGDVLTGSSGWVRSRAAYPKGSGCLEVNFTLTDNAGTDQFLIGWRKHAAFDGANVYTNYADWAVVGLNNVDGSIFSLGEVATGGTLSDDSGVNMADGETRTLKVCIAATTGVPSAYYTANGGTTYTAITMTNSGTAKTDAVQLVPFITYMNAAGTNAGITINWIQLSR